MASTNFLPINPNANNQLNDASYTTSALRTNGAATGQLCPSPDWDKMMYQLGNMIYSLALSLVGRGYSPNDGSSNPSTAIANLVGVLNNLLTYADVPTIFTNPAFTGIPTAPTAAFGVNTNQLATMAALLQYGLRLPAANLRLERGTLSGGDQNVSFSPAFSGVPVIIATGINGSCNIAPGATATGFHIVIANSQGAYWLAIGPA